MPRIDNSWQVRTLLVTGLKLTKLAESIVSFPTKLSRPSTNCRLCLKFILHSLCVVNNAREDPFPLPPIFMPKEVHIRQLATYTYQITPS